VSQRPAEVFGHLGDEQFAQYVFVTFRDLLRLLAGPRPVKWCMSSIAPSSRSTLQLAMSRGTTSSAISAVMAGGSMALASDSALM